MKRAATSLPTVDSWSVLPLRPYASISSIYSGPNWIKYKVYTVEKDGDFGISVYKYIGQKYLPPDYFASELKREITEQIQAHKYVDYVEDYFYEFKGRKLSVEFTCRLINGEKASRTVIIHV